MRNFGIALIAIGLVWIVYALNMDIIVTPTSDTQGIAGQAQAIIESATATAKLAVRQQYFIQFAELTILCGVIFTGFGSITTSKFTNQIEQKSQKIDVTIPDSEPVQAKSTQITMAYCSKCNAMNDANHLNCFRCNEPLNV